MTQRKQYETDGGHYFEVDQDGEIEIEIELDGVYALFLTENDVFRMLCAIRHYRLTGER